MLRFFAGVASALLLVAAGFFVWQGQAERDPIPPAPEPAALATPLGRTPLAEPPAASAKTREEKRFARADRDEDGRITREELMSPRRKAFTKLDANSDGRLSFEEWAVRTGVRFAGADADKSGWLSAAEYETTKAKTKPRRKCAC